MLYRGVVVLCTALFCVLFHKKQPEKERNSVLMSFFCEVLDKSKGMVYNALEAIDIAVHLHSYFMGTDDVPHEIPQKNEGVKL